MTRARRTPTQPTAPLAAHIRAALAAGWHSLSALDVLAGGAASTRRARVHAALAELARAGMVREERTRAEGVEVRELPPVADGATCPACRVEIREHDDHHGWCTIGIRDCSWWAERATQSTPVFTTTEMFQPFDPSGDRIEDESDRPFDEGGDEQEAFARAETESQREIVDPIEWEAATLPAPVPDDGSGWGTPAPDEPLSPAEQERALALRMADECTPAELDELRALEAREEAARAARLQQEAERAEEPRAPTPGPSSRCAVCNVTFARHADRAHPFTPRKRGPAPGPRQRRTPGPIVEVASEARIERAGGPRLAPVGAEGGEERRMREGAARADVRPATAEEIAETDARFGGALTALASGSPIEEVIARASGGHVVPGWRTEVTYQVEAGPCRPPACHYDRINDPARVPLDRLPPLCEAHRGWVEAAQRGAKGASA